MSDGQAVGRSPLHSSGTDTAISRYLRFPNTGGISILRVGHHPSVSKHGPDGRNMTQCHVSPLCSSIVRIMRMLQCILWYCKLEYSLCTGVDLGFVSFGEKEILAAEYRTGYLLHASNKHLMT